MRSMPGVGVMLVMLTVTMIMRVITNRWANHLIPDHKGNHFPEIPESPTHRLTTANSRRQTPEDQKTEHQNNNLKDHEFRNHESGIFCGARERLRNQHLANQSLIHLLNRWVVQMQCLLDVPGHITNA